MTTKKNNSFSYVISDADPYRVLQIEIVRLAEAAGLKYIPSDYGGPGATPLERAGIFVPATRYHR